MVMVVMVVMVLRGVGGVDEGLMWRGGVNGEGSGD